jgi:FtsP/CotA-like multicopper oxidase with cupredoxin domain
MYLPWNASKARLNEAENARRNRAEFVKAWSQGQISRRDLVRLGLLTAGGALVAKHGLSLLAPSAYAEVPTGTPPSPIPRGIAFTQPMPRLEELQRKPVSALSPYPQCESNQTWNAAKGIGPVEGRPPGKWFSHQRWEEFYPRVAVEASMRPLLPGQYFHPKLPMIKPDKLWTVNGTVPFKLIKARYGEPLLFRHHNRLPVSPADNGGFGRNTLTTHLHNGHTPAESDGYAGAFFFPGQYYDYRWVMALAGHDTINPDATDPRAGAPEDGGGIVKVPGDWRETQSTLWFHDHMVDFTAQNVYKGNAAMLNLYSALDRGNEELHDGVNLRLPSGTGASWGNTDYDVNLMLADKALDQDGQLFFDVFERDGFLGDMWTVNAAYKPYLEVERRKYRFRILNAGVSRFVRLCLSDGSKFWWIGNDGNLLERPLLVSRLDEQGVAERYDIVVDFSRYAVGQKVHLVNLLEQLDGNKPKETLTLRDALDGKSNDPCVGRVLELRIARDPPRSDQSQVPSTLVPLPERKPVVRERTFEFGRSGGTDGAPWTIKVDGGAGYGADMSRVSAAPKAGTAEIWHLVNSGGGWDHPVHIHFEEGQTVARDGGVPDWERLGRKDVWRLRPGGRVSVYLQFREFSGTYVEHCHNTVHEDHAMLLRWDVNGGPTAIPNPVPTPSGCSYVDSSELPEAL